MGMGMGGVGLCSVVYTTVGRLAGPVLWGDAVVLCAVRCRYSRLDVVLRDSGVVWLWG